MPNIRYYKYWLRYRDDKHTIQNCYTSQADDMIKHIAELAADNRITAGILTTTYPRLHTRAELKRILATGKPEPETAVLMEFQDKATPYIMSL